MQYECSAAALVLFWAKVDKTSSPHGCWLWTAGRFPDGYGCFSLERRAVGAHRLSWFLANGDIPDDKPCVLHRCDVHCPPGDIGYRRCVNPAHLWLGTHADNMTDRNAKGRQAAGARAGARTLYRGDDHWTHQHPEWVARGERSGAGTHPERIRRGSLNGRAKLTEDDVRTIRARCTEGGVSQRALAAEYGVSQVKISQIVLRKSWRHVQ